MIHPTLRQTPGVVAYSPDSMSACAVIVDRRPQPPSPPSVEGLLAALAHRGPDGKNVLARPRAALGAQYFWSAVEEKGQTQPLSDAESGVDLLFEGRLDDRGELERELGTQPGLADSRLVLAAYLRWGRRCFERLTGPFAVVVYEAARHRLIAARDALGDRTLCYYLGADELALASEAAALLRHPGVSPRLDEGSLARFFTVRPPRAGETYFADVREVPPGHLLVFEDDRLRVERYWPPADLPRIRYRRDAEYVDQFRSLLTESVRCRLRTPRAPAVLMSGGLDSTSVAALAARELADERPLAISWVFDELPQADERFFMDAMIAECGLAAYRIAGDGEWPLRDPGTWRTSPSAPWQGLYWRLQNQAYAAARRAGTSVLLTGEHGDHLYLDRAYWLRDLVAEGRWADAWRELRREFGRRPRALPGAVARAAGWRGRAAAPRPWLTEHARRLLAASEDAPGPLAARERADAAPGPLDPLSAYAASLEIANASAAGIEVRRPFRDRRLVEFMLSVPAHLAYRPGWTKWILRQAMRGILPEAVRQRRQPSTLLPLAARGLVDKEHSFVREWLTPPDAVWRRYVRADWLAATFPRRLQLGLDGIETVIPWQCVCAELWTRQTPDLTIPANTRRNRSIRSFTYPDGLQEKASETHE